MAFVFSLVMGNVFHDHGYIQSQGLKEGRPGGLPLLISNGQGFKGSGLSFVDGFL